MLLSLLLEYQFARRRFLIMNAGGFRFVHTERLFFQKVSGSGKGASPAAHANIAEFAAAALPFQVAGIAKGIEHSGFFPDVDESLLPEIAGNRGQIAARINLAFVRDETYSGSCKAVLGHGVHIA